jgi:peptide/nickel transport system permease protein
VLSFAAKRILSILPILVGVSVVTFALLLVIPGDPVDSLLPPGTPPEVRQELRKELDLDGRADERYVAWVTHVVQGDFGTSTESGESAGTVLFRALGNTAILALAGILVAALLGVAAGMAMAWWSDRAFSKVINLAVIGNASIPQFWLGLLLLYVFAVQLRLLPIGGMGPIVGESNLATRLEYLLLPAVTVAALPFALIARLTRALFLELKSQEFVLALRTRGYSTFRIWRHLLRNAAPGIVNIVGLQAGYALLGTLFAEIVFSWPGMGTAIQRAIDARDYPVIQGFVLVSGVIFTGITVVVDLAMRSLDPRTEAA